MLGGGGVVNVRVVVVSNRWETGKRVVSVISVMQLALPCNAVIN